MRLSQISGGDALSQEVVGRMGQYASLIAYAEFYSMIGNADYVRNAPGSDTAAMRALDADYANNIKTPVFQTPALKIMGNKVQVDRAHERRGADVPSVRARELMNFAEYLGQYWQDQMINGDNTGNNIAGILGLTPAGQKIYGNTSAAALTVSLGNTDAAVSAQQKFMEKLNELVELVRGGAQILFMDGQFIARLSTIAAGQITIQKNDFGRPVVYYNGIPVVPSGFAPDGSRVIDGTETSGTVTNCYSVYALRFGEMSDLTIATNVGVEVKDLGLVGVHYTHSVDLDLQLALVNSKAVAKLEGLKLA